MATELPQSEFTQPRINGLLRGRINKFNLDVLIKVTGLARLVVKVDRLY